MIKKEEFLERIKRIQQKCKDQGLDAFLAASEENLYYFTGKPCFPLERPFLLVIWANRAATYFIPRLELEHLSVIAHIQDFVSYAEYPAPEDVCWSKVLGDLLRGCKKIGTDLYLRSEIYSFLSKKMDVEPYDWAYTMRYIKSDSEIEMMKDVAAYAKDSMQSFIKDIKKGDIALKSLETGKKAQQKATIMKKFDVDFYSTDFISLAWPAPYSAAPHSIPNPLTEYNEGGHVMILSYKLNGYAIELERTFFTSQPTDEMRAYFHHMMKAREIAFSLCKPGTPLSDIDSATRRYFSDQGLEGHVIHRAGHGMGVSNHEGPFVAEGSTTILEEGMTLTIEPGIYFDNFGGFRHSDTILITKKGFENLTESPDELDDLIVTKKSGLRTWMKKLYLKRLL